MVEIGQTFTRFQRVVREISRDLGKQIQLQTFGEDTELDKSMVERIADPLTHLVRNAIDHGIEQPEQRLAIGKPEQGQLILSAYHEAGNIVIEVADDGKGLERDKILAKAMENGLIESAEGIQDCDVFQLIFSPGFSTADVVTDLSGRGVGMDVVKRNIDELQGSIEIQSTPGEGTCLRIRLPLTLAIIDGFMLAVESSQYILPLNSVIECVELDLTLKQQIAQEGYIELRGNLLSVFRLRDLFGFDAADSHQIENIVVVQVADQRIGIIVDALLGEYQTVVKPMSCIFDQLKWVSGSTILGDGRVAIILDLMGMLAMVQQWQPSGCRYRGAAK